MSKGQKYHCGPDSWHPWARAVLTFFLNNDACKEHDKDWSVLGADKKASDEKFRKNLITWWKPWTWVFSPAVYGAVKLGGKKSFDIAQEKAKKRKEICSAALHS